MQQDPSASSSWNKLYRAQPDSTASSASQPNKPASAPTHAAGPPPTASSAIGIAPTTIHARASLSGTARPSSASIPCLTSSHVRPNLNRNSDVLAIHQSFDLAKPSPATPPSLQPAADADAIDAMVAFRSETEQPASAQPSSGLLEHPQYQQKQKHQQQQQQHQHQQQQWPQYSSVSSLSLRGRRDGFQQDVGASDRVRRTDDDKIESTSDSDMDTSTKEPLRVSKAATAAMKRIRVRPTRVSKSHISVDPGPGPDPTPGLDIARPLQAHAPVPGAHTVLDASGARGSQRVHIHSSHAELDSSHVQTWSERRGWRESGLRELA
ncbi:hypothetical protein BGZ72_009314 [Mortierella alpina]|nr:hypothetical protein BGZ72_009314 [Mortierella alpina]